MSLSQKHAGLVLVPWFNSNEWNYVYKLLYSGDKSKMSEALNLLKLWKIRTPILSTGVEGSLILLEALLIDTEDLSDEKISHLYALALVRFLNLSAANNEKQGTFNKTSEKNELPKWMINLRHDIAHGHQVPSKNNLTLALDYGFQWLKEKYWEPQSKILNDYIKDNNSIPQNDTTLLNALKTYLNLNIALYESQRLDKNYMELMKKMIFKKCRKKINDPYQMLTIWEEVIRQSLVGLRNDSIQKLLDVIVSNEMFLKPHFKINEGKERMDNSFKDIWKNLLNILNDQQILFILINRLFDVISDISYSENAKCMAAIWIKEILESLQMIKSPNKILEEANDYLDLSSSLYLYHTEAADFQKKVVNFPNKFSTYFMEILLKYNESTEDFINQVEQLTKTQVDFVGHMKQMENKIYTLEDLIVENLSLEESIYEENGGIARENIKTFGKENREIIGGSIWQPIQDNSIFKSCPLGILPHQVGRNHPFLEIN